MEPTSKQTASFIVGAVWLLQMLYFQGKGSRCAHVSDTYECAQGHVQPLTVGDINKRPRTVQEEENPSHWVDRPLKALPTQHSSTLREGPILNVG